MPTIYFVDVLQFFMKKDLVKYEINNYKIKSKKNISSKLCISLFFVYQARKFYLCFFCENMKVVKTNDGSRGGTLAGKPHYDKDGKPLGGIKAVVGENGNKIVELEGGEVIINKEASKLHWKELSKINQSAGNGVPILPPEGFVEDEDPETMETGGNIITFKSTHLPNKIIVDYAEKIKTEYPEIWDKAGNIFGNEAFKNLSRVRKRGYWLPKEKWMYVKWRSYVARHKQDFRIEGVVAMLKWTDTVEKGWPYMKNLIEEEIKKIDSKDKKAKGGIVGKRTLKSVIHLVDWKGEGIKKWYLRSYPTDDLGEELNDTATFKDLWDALNEKKDVYEIIGVDDSIVRERLFEYLSLIYEVDYSYVLNKWLENDKFAKGGNLSKTPAPSKDRIEGSKINKPGSAASKEAAKSIELDEAILKAIKNKITEHNTNNPNKKINVATAKAVVRRGMGAYSTTHRPTISGGKPNSRVAWGLARLNAFLFKAANGYSKSGKFVEDDDLLLENGITAKMEQGGNMKTYGCVMTDLKVDDSSWNKIQEEIADEDVYTSPDHPFAGRVTDPHVTILFGLHCYVEDDLIESCCTDQKIKCFLKNISLFENENYDVLKFDIQSDELNYLNQKLKELPHTTDYPEYHPHCTICYLKKGMGKKYVDKLGKFNNMEIEPSIIKYSKGDGTKQYYELGGKTPSKKITKDEYLKHLLRTNLAVDLADYDLKKFLKSKGYQQGDILPEEIRIDSTYKALSEAFQREYKMMQDKAAPEVTKSLSREERLEVLQDYKRIKHETIAERDLMKLATGGSIDKIDNVNMDVPLLIRIMEMSREDIKSDEELHKVAERIIAIKDKDVLTMDDYRMISGLSELKKKR